jgi:thioredoxin 1
MSHSSFRSLDSEDMLEEALAASAETPVVLFKHSAICPISALAHRQVKKLTEPSDPPVYKLVVQEHRPVSNAIADRFGIRHESPQAIVVYEGEPIFHTSHTSITARALREVITEVTA